METPGRLPDFLILGAAKSGTSFLHELLLGHPRVAFQRDPHVPRANSKEIHFFDSRAYEGRGLAWYKRRFPFGPDVVTGEATPYYLFHPRVPDRVRETMPDAKLIVVLREPVSRAFSDWRHRKRDGLEPLSFKDAVRAEPRRIRGERERMKADPSYHSDEVKLHAYLARGFYAEQLERWLLLFPEEQLFVLSSEDLFADPDGAAREVFSFLGLPPHPVPVPLPQNTSPGREEPEREERMGRLLRWRLHHLFRPHNERLYALLGKDLGW